MLIDFDCRILCPDRLRSAFSEDYNNNLRYVNLSKDLFSLFEFGFHRFVCQINYDCSLSPLEFKRQCKQVAKDLSKSIKQIMQKAPKIIFAPKVPISQDTPYIKGLSNLCISGTNKILIDLPRNSNYYDDIQLVLNKLLYKHKLFPIFTDFNLVYLAFPEEQIEKFISINNAGFIFSFQSLTDCNIRNLIIKIIRKNNFVLLSSSCTYENFDKAYFAKILQDFKKSLGENNYYKLVLSSSRFLD